LQGYIVNK